MSAEPAMTPLPDGRQGVLEVAAGARQAVLDAARVAGHDAAFDQPCVLQLAKPAAAQAVRHPRHGMDDRAEARRTRHQHPEDGAGPPAADQLDGLVVEGAGDGWLTIRTGRCPTMGPRSRHRDMIGATIRRWTR